MKLTLEEINLVCVYDSDTREQLIADMQHSLPYIFEPEALELMATTISKLERMSDDEYENMEFFPVYETIETEV